MRILETDVSLDGQKYTFRIALRRGDLSAGLCFWQSGHFPEMGAPGLPSEPFDFTTAKPIFINSPAYTGRIIGGA